MKKIVIIFACVVMLAALGFAAWRLYIGQLPKKVEPVFICNRWHAIGAKWDGNKLIGYPDPLSKIQISELPNKEMILEDACDWITTSFYSSDGNGDVSNYDSRFVYKTLDELVGFLKKESPNLKMVDPTIPIQKEIYAKVDDCLLLMTKDSLKTELPNGYQFLEDGNTRYRFQIYQVQNVGDQQFGFLCADNNGNSTNVVVNVNVIK